MKFETEISAVTTSDIKVCMMKFLGASGFIWGLFIALQGGRALRARHWLHADEENVALIARDLPRRVNLSQISGLFRITRNQMGFQLTENPRINPEAPVFGKDQVLRRGLGVRVWA